MSLAEKIEPQSALPAPLSPLPHPVYFVYNDRPNNWGPLYDPACLPPSPDSVHSHFGTSAADIWILQTYMQLRRRGLDVRLARQLVPGAINVASRYELGGRSRADRAYVVPCRMDSPRPHVRDQVIVQNPHNIESLGDHLIQHWPQPGLIRRDPARDARLEQLVYKGGKVNLYEGFRGPEFRAALGRLGIGFAINDEGDSPDLVSWHDYRQDDALLAVRDLTESDYYLKPASKLTNAWQAGVPALLGPEPAYRALRQSELDYFEVRTIDDVVGVLAHLKGDPGLYRAVVANGLRRGREFDADHIARRWRDVLAEPVAYGFERWRSEGPIRRALRPVRFALRLLADRLELRRYRRSRDHGFRPISGRTT